ncbi:helix-turn-helix domain-containing protein [Nakamurella lactea]|uniref:helix-turn-helix domain-containing protein n=1 Tax=Nakamurella lactea TaxID=459515 RepID=UPI00041179BD|nr:helix-turn-helix domain-containing protein [Nakamurella lactea]
MTTTITDTARLLLNTHEVSQQLGISRTKVYELMASGRLRSVQIGRSRRVPTFALHEFIEELSRDE